jgi:hypothetical protein
VDTERLTAVMDSLMNQTVLGELLAPVARALAQIRGTDTVSRVLSMADFIGLGVLRHLQGMRTLREQVQSLLHWEPGTALRAPLARSTWSDALSSRHRRAVLQAAMAPLLGEARAVLPDRLAQFPALQGRPVYAMDGTYQSESAHYGRCTPRQGGEDNPKGHALLSFYDVRLGCPTDVHVDTRSRHETALLRDYDQSAQPMTRHKGALWLVDRAFIDAAFWDSRKKRLGMTLITRMKSSLCIESTEPLPVADVPTNEGVLKDLRITLRSSRQNWRLITFRSPRGHLVEFLTNEFKLEPGVIAFLYSRRWEEEKCFDTWKNDFSLAKAWGRQPGGHRESGPPGHCHQPLGGPAVAPQNGPARNRGRESVAQAGPAPDLRDRRDRSPRLEHPGIPLHLEGEPPSPALLQALFSQTSLPGAL